MHTRYHHFSVWKTHFKKLFEVSLLNLIPASSLGSCYKHNSLCKLSLPLAPFSQCCYLPVLHHVSTGPWDSYVGLLECRTHGSLHMEASIFQPPASYFLIPRPRVREDWGWYNGKAPCSWWLRTGKERRTFAVTKPSTKSSYSKQLASLFLSTHSLFGILHLFTLFSFVLLKDQATYSGRRPMNPCLIWSCLAPPSKWHPKFQSLLAADTSAISVTQVAQESVD